MRRYLQTNTIPVVNQVGGHTFPLPVCSVVGGAPVPVNESHGTLIDASVVYRINTRVPEFLAAESLPTKLGRRTHIIVFQGGSISKLELFIGTTPNQSKASKVQIARARAGRILKKQKPVLLYRLGFIRGTMSWKRGWKILDRSTVQRWSPLSFMNPSHEIEAVKQLNRVSSGKYEMPDGYDGIMPTSGLVAIMNALSNCQHVNLFAFNGSTRSDGNYPDKSGLFRMHSGNLERELVRWLARCPPEESWMCGRLTLFS